jgi:hypothetical protein
MLELNESYNGKHQTHEDWLWELNQAWVLAKKHLENTYTKRSSVSYLKHVEDGLKILDLIGACRTAKRAFCLHPLLQTDTELFNNLDEVCTYCGDTRAVALAMEYRWIANTNLRHSVKDRGWTIPHLNLLPCVKNMLIADKIQNLMDFRTYQKLPSRDTNEIETYFSVWLSVLGVSSIEYNEIVRIIEEKP